MKGHSGSSQIPNSTGPVTRIGSNTTSPRQRWASAARPACGNPQPRAHPRHSRSRISTPLWPPSKIKTFPWSWDLTSFLPAACSLLRTRMETASPCTSEKANRASQRIARIPLWTNLHAGFGLTNSMIYGSASDSAGNLYLTAYATAPGRSDYDWVTVKYSGEGRAVWTNRFDGAAGRTDMPFGLAVDSAGGVYVTGESENQYGSGLITVKYADLLEYTPPKDFTGSATLPHTL